MSHQLRIPKYRLIYFDGKGRAELCRLMFACKGIPYEDVRVTSEEWGKMKENTPCYTLPILEIDGKQYGQSMAITRFVAREYGMYGNSNLHMAEVDMVLDFILDAQQSFVGVIFEKDPEKKREKFIAGLGSDNFTRLMKRMNERLEESKSGFLVGHALTLADLSLMNFMEHILENTTPELMVHIPENIQAHYKRISTEPVIKCYRESRKKTPF